MKISFLNNALMFVGGKDQKSYMRVQNQIYFYPISVMFKLQRLLYEKILDGEKFGE